jgi:hypothetical protein
MQWPCRTPVFGVSYAFWKYLLLRADDFESSEHFSQAERATMENAYGTGCPTFTVIPEPRAKILRCLLGMILLSLILAAPSPVHALTGQSGKASTNIHGFHEPDFSRIDDLAKNMPEPRSYQDVSDFLRKNSSSDQEIARGAYVWIAENISYDGAALFAGRIVSTDAETVFRTRKAVCDGYATIYEAICAAAGLKAPKVYGYAKGYGDYPNGLREGINHAWNAVWLSGDWRLVDVAWGAGYLSGRNYVKKYASFWFETAPELFMKWHLPQDPGWLLLDRQVSLAEFQSMKTLDIYSIEKMHEVGFTASMISEVVAKGYLPEMYRVSSMKSLGFSAQKIQQGILSGYLPQSWQYDDVRVQVMDAPTNGVLSSGKEYRFVIQTGKPVQIAAIINDHFSKFSRKGTRHLLSVRCEQGELRLSVKRNGSNYYPVLVYKTI